MKQVNRVGIIAFLIIIILAINFLSSPWSWTNTLYFLSTCLGVGYLASELQALIKQKI